MQPPVQIHGYHGTSISAVEGIKASGFLPSTRTWDWLGDGAYFFQDAPMRAWEWAKQQHPSEPAVLCASIRLDGCIDLLDIPWVMVMAGVYGNYRARRAAAGQPLPHQDSSTGNRQLDRRVFNYAANILEQQGERVAAIRGVFQEGAPIFPNSGLYDRSHVQIAIRDRSLIEEIWRADEEGRRIA